jgi:hypothetical protein
MTSTTSNEAETPISSTFFSIARVRHRMGPEIPLGPLFQTSADPLRHQRHQMRLRHLLVLLRHFFSIARLFVYDIARVPRLLSGPFFFKFPPMSYATTIPSQQGMGLRQSGPLFYRHITTLRRKDSQPLPPL